MPNQENQNNIIVYSDAEMLDVLNVDDIHRLWHVSESKVWGGNIFGILEPQEFEREEDAVFYETVYATCVNPVMVKNGRKWMWRYWDKTFTFVL